MNRHFGTLTLCLWALSSSIAWSQTPTPFLLKETIPGPLGGASRFVVVGDTYALFSAFSQGTGSGRRDQYWLTDGSAAGTQHFEAFDTQRLVSAYQPGPGRLVMIGSEVLALNESLFSVWYGDGTVDGMQKILEYPTDPNGQTEGILPLGIRYFDSQDITLFSRFTKSHGFEPWTSDGTAAGTVRLADLVPGAEGSFPSFFELNGQVFMRTSRTTPTGQKRVLWTTDGTLQGTTEILEGERGGVVLFEDDKAYLTEFPQQGTIPKHLAETDGTLTGTRRLLRLPDGEDHRFFFLGEHLLFYVYQDNSRQFQTWVTDGTSQGTRRVPGLRNDNPNDFRISELTEDGLWLVDSFQSIWSLRDPDVGFEVVFDCAGEPGCQVISSLVPDDRSDPTFQILTPDFGLERWTSDGTPEGTRMLFDACEGECDSSLFPWPLLGRQTESERIHSGRRDLGVPATQGLHNFLPYRKIFDFVSITDAIPYAVLGNRVLTIADDGTTGMELWALDFPGAECTPSVNVLCLGGDRFEVKVRWTDFQGGTGEGQSVPLTQDTGSFWFFDSENLELIVKVIDGTAINGNHWVFFGSLSDVAYELTVTDTATGRSKTYSNPAGTFASRGDIEALPGSSSKVVRDADSALATEVTPEELSTGTSDAGANACASSGTQLCLSNRFAVEVDWTDFQGGSGVGRAVELVADTGGFWFFDADNLELIVKVLDGRAINGKFWVFYGALSNVGYEITVTDTVTGAVERYSNPSGNFGSLGDIDAFEP